MECSRAKRLISLQPDGQLTVEESALLAMHLAECPACAREQQLQQRLSGVLRELGRVTEPAPVDFTSRVMQELKAQRRGVLSYIPLAWRKVVAAAAAALMLVAGASGGATDLWRLVTGGGKNMALEPRGPAGVDGSRTGEYIALNSPDVTNAPNTTAPLGVSDPFAGDAGTGPPADPAQPDEPAGAGEIATPRTGGAAGNEAGAAGNTPEVESLMAANAPAGTTALLSDSMKVTSTVLKFAVGDIDAARAKAVSIAAGAGAANQVFPEQNSGKPVLVMRMTIEAARAGDLINSLQQVGNLVDRQDESRDLTTLYNETVLRYNDLLQRRSQAQDAAEQQKLAAQAAAYKQQLDAWSEEAGKRVLMVWLEEK